MDKLERLIAEYEKRFDDNVPMRELVSASKTQLIELIQKALKEGKPIKIEYNDDFDY